MSEMVQIRLSDAISLREVDVVSRGQVFGIPVDVHVDLKDFELYCVTEPTSGAAMARGVSVEDALANAECEVLARKSERISPKGYLNKKIAGLRQKIAFAQKRRDTIQIA